MGLEEVRIVSGSGLQGTCNRRKGRSPIRDRGDPYDLSVPGFSPVIAADNYGRNGGQVRLNLFMGGPWLLRETEVTRDTTCSGASCALSFSPVTVKTNPFGGLFSANSQDPRAADFRATS